MRHIASSGDVCSGGWGHDASGQGVIAWNLHVVSGEWQYGASRGGEERACFTLEDGSTMSPGELWIVHVLMVEGRGTEPPRERRNEHVLTVENGGTVPPGEVRNAPVLTVEDGGTLSPGEVWKVHVLTVEDGDTLPRGEVLATRVITCIYRDIYICLRNIQGQAWHL